MISTKRRTARDGIKGVLFCLAVFGNRYTLTDNQLKHDYSGDTDNAMEIAFQVSIEVLSEQN